MTQDRATNTLPTAAGKEKAVGSETIGPLLTRLRQVRGLTQLQVADRICGLSGRPTISRHEVSRWEREERVPGPYWRGWLAAVLDVPLEQLEAAMARTRPDVDPAAIPGIKRAVDQPQLWRVPTADQLLAALDLAKVDVRGLAHAWLAGPLQMPDLDAGAPPHHALSPHSESEPFSTEQLETRLGVLRRQDDLAGGRRLATVVDRELRAAIAALRRVGGGQARRRLLRTVARYAQLAGWVRADAGQDMAARRAYRVALQAAAVAGDRDLAGYVLGSLSHLRLVEDAHEALLLAQSGHTGVRDDGSLLTRALLLHRVALAAARVGERRTAEIALAEAERLADQSEPRWEPAWLYWLDQQELAAMTGRCLAVLGRPLRAIRLLNRRRTEAGPRTAALYGVWLARSYLDLGEVEQACKVASLALTDAAASGSARAADALRHLHPMLLPYGRVAAVQDYERQAEQLADRLPGGGHASAGGARRRATSGGARRSGTRQPTLRNRNARPTPVKAGQPPRAGSPATQRRSPATAAQAAITPGTSARVPMGIRHTGGSGGPHG